MMRFSYETPSHHNHSNVHIVRTETRPYIIFKAIPGHTAEHEIAQC